MIPALILIITSYTVVRLFSMVLNSEENHFVKFIGCISILIIIWQCAEVFYVASSLTGGLQQFTGR